MTLSDPPNDSLPFSVFRALRVEHHEVRHSNFLAWLIDPLESHGQGSLFFRGFLEAVTTAIENGALAKRLLLDESSAQDVKIRREKDRLDLHIILNQPKIVVGIENKIFASEHSDQLSRYADDIESQFKGWDQILLYLTLDGEAPSDPRWCSFTHRKILSMIEKRISLLHEDTPEAIRAFVEHYVQLLRDIYSVRPERMDTDHKLRELVDKWVEEDARIYEGAQEDIPGLHRFESVLRRIVQVPKADVDRRMAEDKAARELIRRKRKENRRGL
jgi:hypothetical protein